jgi:hypothetical protein
MMLTIMKPDAAHVHSHTCTKRHRDVAEQKILRHMGMPALLA